MDILGILGGAVTVLGGVAGVLAWMYHKGGDDRELTVAVRENTAANRELTGAMAGVKDVLSDHETRLSVVESKVG